MKNKIVAGLLAFFLGGFGMHKFYLGNAGMGIIYLLFCWTLIPAIASFIEAIILFSMSDKEFDMRYNRPPVMYPNNNVLNNSRNISDNLDNIRKLHRLKEDGIITEEEFEIKKKKLL
jgi:TM2 domain-containing membrane protein YozV